MKQIRGDAVDRAVRKISQLRALFRRLPHVPTPAEVRLLAEFDDLHSGRAAICSAAAIRSGFRAAWRTGDYAKIVDVGRKLPPGMLETDATALAYFENALRTLSLSPREVR